MEKKIDPNSISSSLAPYFGSLFMKDPPMWTPQHVRQSTWTEHVPFAFWLIEALKPDQLVELGTFHGMSYLAFCQAIARLGLPTRAVAIDTWEGDVHAGGLDEGALASLRRAHDPQYSNFSTLMQSTFDEAVKRFEDGSISILHIDGLHSYEAVRNDYEKWRPKMQKSGVILFHDTQVHDRGFGVYKLWAELQRISPSFEFEHGHGLGVIGMSDYVAQPLRVLFDASSNVEDASFIRERFAYLGRNISAKQDAVFLQDQLRKLKNDPIVKYYLGARRRIGHRLI